MDTFRWIVPNLNNARIIVLVRDNVKDNNVYATTHFMGMIVLSRWKIFLAKITALLAKMEIA